MDGVTTKREQYFDETTYSLISFHHRGRAL